MFIVADGYRPSAKGTSLFLLSEPPGIPLPLSLPLLSPSFKMPSGNHRVARPRLAFNCLECSRQKRRCDKLKPQCTTCLRLGRTCIYNIGTRDPETGRVSRTIIYKETIASSTSQDTRELKGDIDNNKTITGASRDRVTRLDKLPIDAFRGLKLQRGARERYISKGFWAFLKDQDNTGGASIHQSLFYNEPKSDPSMPPSYILSLGLAKLLLHLPSKPICDTLLRSFLDRVHPIFPLIDFPSFMGQYRLFWRFFASDSSLLHPELLKDPTYICLIWAILYAGSSVVSYLEWDSIPLKDLDQLQTIEQLRVACSESLVACRHTDHPTLDSLTASIIAYHFDASGKLSKSLFIPTTLRLAQSMGLHLDPPISPEPSTNSTEHRRRIWWHIVWLDLQTSVSTGLPTCCNDYMVHSYSMVSTSRYPTIPGNPEPELSMIMLWAAGRFQTLKLQHRLMGIFQNPGEPQAKEIIELAKSTKELHGFIDDLIAKIPVQGIPEKGMIPSSLANVNPYTSPHLYEDRANESTVLSACARIALYLSKLETVIMLQHALLPDLSSRSSSHFSWNRIVRLCLSYLQCYLKLCQVPAFSPYSWYWSSYHGPRRCILLMLHYLRFSYSDPKDKQDMLFCIDEFIVFWSSVIRLVPVRCEATSVSMEMITKMRQQLDERIGGNNDTFEESLTGLGVANTLEHIDYLEDLFDSDY